MQSALAIKFHEFYLILRRLSQTFTDLMGGKLILKLLILEEPFFSETKTIFLPGIKAEVDKTSRHVPRSPNYSASQAKIYWRRHPKHVPLFLPPSKAIHRSRKLEVSSCDNDFNLKGKKLNFKLDFGSSPFIRDAILAVNLSSEYDSDQNWHWKSRVGRSENKFLTDTSRIQIWSLISFLLFSITTTQLFNNPFKLRMTHHCPWKFN